MESNKTSVVKVGLLALALLVGGCAESGSDAPAPASLQVPSLEGGTPWTDLNPEDAPDDFHFVVVSDRTGGARPGVFSGAMPKINLLSPAFVVSVGDLIEGYTENQSQLDYEWDQIESFVAELDAPFFYAAGNHDMNNAVMARTWQQRFGPSYYHFNYKGVLFLVLNSELFGMVGQPDTPVPGPWQQSEQLEFVRSVLAQHADARWTIVLLHQPLWDAPEIDPDWLEVETMLGNRPYTVFAGHFHQYNLVRRNDRKFITLATTGGGSSLRGSAFGEFDQVAWVTMREDGPVIANVEIDGVHDDSVSSSAVRQTLDELAAGIVIENPVADDELFASTAQRVLVTNPTAEPMTASPQVQRNGTFDISGLVPVTVAPGETAELFMRLESDPPMPYRDLVAAGLQWTLTTSLDGRPVQFPVRKAVLPLSHHAIDGGEAITVDGGLAEWGELRFRASQQGDILSPELAAEDISFAFDVRESADHLNLAIAVTDDDIQHLPDNIARNQDAVAIYVDPRPAEARDRNMDIGRAVLGGDMEGLVGTLIGSGPTSEDKLLGFVAEADARSAHAITRTDTGYTIELAIPLAYLAEKAGTESWRVGRVAVSVYDLDAGDHAPVSLHWQPWRYGGAPMTGSHLFRRP